MKCRAFPYLLLFLVVCISCHQEQEIPVSIDFDYTVTEASYTVPVEITIANKTTGADFYNWTFEGASPSTSDLKQPGAITYDRAGTYTIKLEAWNDTQRNVKEIILQLDSAVTLDFEVAVLVNDFAPGTIQITNNTRGASSYEWTFEGGVPETSNDADPPQVTFDSPGEHTISLVVSNGRETFASSRTITLQPALDADFDIIPSFEDEDYEAPLTATLQNKTISGLRYTWTSTGGTIADPAAEHTEIYFSGPGEYTVTLSAENDKEIRTVDHTILVKPNNNLYSMSDVKLGVSAAHATIGCFYSIDLRSTLTKDSVTTDNGDQIDLVFFAINSSFSYCRFVSPDSASEFAFPPIPQATHTYFINTLETSALSFTPAQFDAMTNDTPLTNLDIRANDSGISFFSGSQVPRIVLFETASGRRGAIRIKNFVAEGTQSYIVVDIKVQKLKP